jgi:RimJ/RimL family protein N-acetyltransferase
MIFGDRIRLRAIERADLAFFQAWLNDPEVRTGLSMVLPFSQVEEERWFDQMLERPDEEHSLVIEIDQPEGWMMVGTCSLFAFDWRVRSAEFGIVIGAKGYWDQGYGSEAAQLMLRHAFETLNLNRVQLRVNANNARAIRSYEKVGYVQEGRFRQAAYIDGKYVDVFLMSTLRSDWVGNQVDPRTGDRSE